jgi:hypothetical protein
VALLANFPAEHVFGMHTSDPVLFENFPGAHWVQSGDKFVVASSTLVFR